MNLVDVIARFHKKDVQNEIIDFKKSIKQEIEEAWEKYQEDFRAEFYDMRVPELGARISTLTGYSVIGNGISRITFDLGDKVLKLEISDEIMQNKNEYDLYKDFRDILPKYFYVSDDFTLMIFEKLKILNKEDYEDKELLTRGEQFISSIKENNCSFWEIEEYQNGYLGLTQEGRLVLADAGTFSCNKTFNYVLNKNVQGLQTENNHVKGW